MEPLKIKIEDWELFGEGGVGQTYIRKDDDTVILKLNDESWPAHKALDEYTCSRAVCELGIPCPAIYDYVTDGKRFGYTSEFIKGKISLSRMIASEPARMAELARLFARRSKELHSMECDTATFESTLAKQKEIIDRSTNLPDDVRATMEEYYKEFDKSTITCLHGDFHMGNLILAGGKEYWIDLGTFSYGDPLIDISNLYMIGYCLPSKMTEDLFHMKISTFRRFYRMFLEEYYGADLNDELLLRIKHAALFRCGLAAAARPDSAPLFIPQIRGQRLRAGIIKMLAGLAKKKI